MSHPISSTTTATTPSVSPTFTASSSTGLTSADWVTRDDMAALTRKSADTVTRDIKKHQLSAPADEAGRVLVNVGDFLEIGRLRPEDLTAGTTPAESAEVLRARETITELKERAAELTGRLGNSDTLVTTLREQLAVKDKQHRQAGRADHRAHRPPRRLRHGGRCGMTATARARHLRLPAATTRITPVRHAGDPGRPARRLGRPRSRRRARRGRRSCGSAPGRRWP